MTLARNPLILSFLYQFYIYTDAWKSWPPELAAKEYATLLKMKVDL